MVSSPEFSKQAAALVSGCGIADFSTRVQIELTGTDRASFLHNLCTADIKQLSSWQGCEAFFANVQGKILAHALIFASQYSHVIETVAGQNEKLLTHLDRYLIREDVELRDLTSHKKEILVGGKMAADLLAEQIPNPLPQNPCDHIEATIAGSVVALRRVEMILGGSFLLSGTADAIESVQSSLLQAGALKCDSDVVESARVEAGWPSYGLDISEDNLPQEVDRDQKAISFTKGCYLGQETVARIDALGHVNKKLVGIRFQNEEVPPTGLELSVNDKTIGQISSPVYSARLSSPLSFAYVRREHSQPGTKLSSNSGPAEVIKLPLSQD